MLLHDQCPGADPFANHLISPHNAAFVLIDYQRWAADHLGLARV